MRQSALGTGGSSASRVWLTLTVPALIVALTMVMSSNTRQETRSNEERVLAVVREDMEATRYCFLVTLDDLGQPQARVMDAFDPEADMTVWMATDPKTRKVRQLRHDPRATLAYDLGGGRGYVTLIGRVQLVDDEEERRAHWKSGWEAFYPEGPTGADYLLLKFTPSRIEAMNIPENVGTIPFSPVILLREGSTWKLHERSG